MGFFDLGRGLPSWVLRLPGISGRWGKGPKIRKDAGELTIADWQMYPVWNFCLDEEGVEVQTECTVRPWTGRPPVRWPRNNGGIACDLVLAGGKRFLGVQWLCGAELDDEARHNVELWLDRPAQELCDEPLPDHYNYTIHASWHRLCFHLAAAEHDPDAEVLERIRLVYKVLGVTAAGMWPMEVTPRVAIRGWPRSWQVHGWCRQDGAMIR